MQRQDGRSTTSLRPMSLTQSILPRSDGSASFSFGNVTVLSSITGPTEVRLREELVSRATFEINVKPLRQTTTTTGGPSLRQIESTLRSLYEPLILLNVYPRSLIQLSTQTTSLPSTLYSKTFSSTTTTTTSTLNNDDDDAEKKKEKRTRRRRIVRGVGVGAGEKAARINSCTMSLIDSGVQLKGVVLACSIGFLPLSSSTRTNNDDDDEEEEEEEEVLLVDPTVEEEERSTSTHVITCSFGTSIGEGEGGKDEGTIVGVESLGRFDQDQLFEAQTIGLKACQTILGFVRRSIETKYGVAPSSTSASGGGHNEGKEGEVSSSEDEDEDEEMSI